MNQDNSILINFRIDEAIKNQFHRACRSAQSNMTVELNRMIRQFVADHKQPTIFERPLKWLTGDKASKP
jgi:antitoxin component of RelBE/YafQ-DinJ toxin-antitoxin module